MLNSALYEYYLSHKEDYPVTFSIMDDGLAMSKPEGGNVIALLEDRSYEVFPSDEVPYVFVNSLIDDAETYQFEMDENNPRQILDAFIDCTYLQLSKLRNEVDKMMAVIDGREG